jgi:DNA-binding transcriptional LysR family regulator
VLPLNTHRLRILREIAARGTITAAAEALHVTGPAVSHQIRTLERELGVPLLEHTPRSVRLTEAGHLLVRHAERILAECEAAEAAVRAYASEVSGLVRVSLNEVPYELHVLMAMRLQERHPALEVLLASIPPAEALAALRVGTIDIVLSMEWECRPAALVAGTTRHDLLIDSYEVALSPDHPLAHEDGPLRLRDLAHERWCMTQEPRFREALEQTMRAAGIEVRPVFEGTIAYGVAAACSVGFGVGLIPNGMALTNVVARPLDEPALTRHVFALVRSGSEQSIAIRTVLDAMDEGAVDAVRRGVGSLPAARDAQRGSSSSTST